MIKIDTFDTENGKKSFTTIKGQERIKQILKNAEIVFFTKGYSGFSMRGVANQSDISLSTLQHYFKNKDTLLKALLKKLISDYINRIEHLISLNSAELPLHRFMGIISNIIYEIEQPIITNTFKEFFSISDHLPYVHEALTILQKYNFELIYKIILPIHTKISSEEYKERALIIITQLNGYLVQYSNKNTDEYHKVFLRNILLKNISRLVSEP
ncbi:TetR/AcrR family transcriptional regulator [Acinetobacter sp. XS-4]|uniref:TetR/AcrR family transcriptional regulator n=1 Tax=Acinetobacter sp. XS-4 TaxID=2923375 RepID=UPI00208E4F68|nr:TetR/AcrR family transcriptional regulator [Acinetobacter sp. XS-4]USP41636.1 TetR/AcrR family transcriptional regulator [Acinetobacter sp. XS-4]